MLKHAVVMKNIYIYLLVSMLFIGIGCDDILDVDQPDIVEDDNAFQSYNEGLVTIIGCYQGLQEAVDQLFLLGNLRSDLMLANDNAPAYFRELSDGIYSSSNPYLDSSPFYKIVNQCNDIIANMSKLQANDPENVDEHVVDKFTAEAMVIRALAYYYIIQNFDNVYYYEQALTEYDPSLKLEPTPKSEVLVTLIEQIEYYMYQKDVGNLVVENQISGNYRWYKFRFGEYASMRQLLAELYLELGASYKAFEELLKVINEDDHRQDRFSLSSVHGFSKWGTIFESLAYTYTTNEELILTVPFFKKNAQIYNVQYWCSNRADGVYYLKPSPTCIANFVSQGENGDVYRGEGITYKFINGEPVVYKYILNSGMYDYDNSFVLFRAGDTFLDACEALNHKGRPDEALALLNEGTYEGEKIRGVSLGVRGRVGLAPLKAGDYEPLITLVSEGVVPSLLDSMKAVDMAILDERAREQAFETSRFYDIRRIAEYWDDPAIISDIISSKYKGVDNAKEALVRERYLNRENWYIKN